MFRVKNTNYVNALLFSLFFIVVLVSYIQKKQAGQHFSGIVKKAEKGYKYKVNYLHISLDDTKNIDVKYPNSFFDVARFLRFRDGDSVQYSTLDNKVSSIKNLQNGNELDELYFSIQESKGFQLVILVLLFFYNVIQMKKLQNLIGILKKNENRASKTKLQQTNDFTKKYAAVTIIVLAASIFLIYAGLKAVNNHQNSFEDYHFYKYFIMLFSFLIPMPFVIVNNRLLKKVNSYKR